MEQHNLVPATDSEDATADELLTKLDAYIIDTVSKKMSRLSSSVVPPDILDLEIDEMIQLVRIKLWQAQQQQQPIQYPRAYIQAIVTHAYVDRIRAYKNQRAMSLQAYESSELYTGDMIATPQDEVNPASVFEQTEATKTVSADIAMAVLSLPPRQRQAMIASLAEQEYDVSLVLQELKNHQVDVDMGWPEDKSERQRLRASLSVARKKIGHVMRIKQSECDGTNNTPVAQQPGPIATDGNELLASGQQNKAYERTEIETPIDILPEPYRTEVQLHCVNKRTFQQIAHALSLPIGTVKSHISRGRKMLRKARNIEPALQKASEQRADIAELVARVEMLHEPYRTPVQLHYVQQHTYQQIASDLNLPKGTVKSYISRGLKILRDRA